MGTYTKSSINRAARPRSERLRQIGGAIVSTSASVMGGGGGGYTPSGDSHTHANLADLNMITVTDGYIYLTDTYTDEITGNQVTETVKVNAGYADRAGANADGYTLDWFIPVTVDGSLTLKLNPIYAGIWAEGWGAAGGVGSGGSGGGSTVTVTQILSSGTSIATITVDGVATTLYAPAGGGGGSTVAWGTVSGYVVPLTVDGVTKSLLLSGALTDYATQSWVTQQGYLTSSALTGYATQAWVGQQGYLTSSALSGYATETWVTQRGYATQTWVGQQGYLTSETDPTVPSWAKASSKPSYSLSEITSAADVQAIEALTGTGLLKRTGTNTWALDSTAYLSSHQTIYALTLSAGTFSAGSYTPNSAAKSFSIPTTLDHISDGSTRKLANYLPLAGGTMTGAITMSGANILTAADSTNQIGSVTNRFGNGFFRNLYTTYFGFRDESDGSKQWGHLGCGDGYCSIYLEDGQGSSYGWYVFNSAYGFFHNGDGNVPCGRSDHRWDTVWSEDGNFSGGLTVSGSIVVGGDVVPAADITSSLGYSGRRFTSGNIVNVYTRNVHFKHQSTGKTDGLIAGGDGYFRIRTGADIDTAYKDIVFHETYGFYPEQSGVNLGYGSAAQYRWANIYGVNADLSGNLILASTSHIDIGPLRLEYNANTKALHITKVSSSDANDYGLYADGQVAAGGAGGDNQYIRYVNCTQTEYNNLTPDPTTMYYIGDPVTKIYLGTVVIYSES